MNFTQAAQTIVSTATIFLLTSGCLKLKQLLKEKYAG